MLKKILVWGGLAFLVFFIAFRPNEASAVAKAIGGGVWDVLTGFADFISRVVT